MVFYPAILLLLLGSIGRRLGIVGKILIVLAIKQTPWWSKVDTCLKLRASSWEELVVGRCTVERNGKVQVVRITIGHQHIVPVLHHVALISHLYREGEVIIRPTQALAPSEA